MTLAELVYGYLTYRERSKENELWVKCPFCNDNQYRMGLNLANGKAQCFRGSCGWKTSNKTYLFNSLAKQFGVTSTLSDKEQPKQKEKQEVKHLPVKMPSEFEPLWKDVNEEIGKRALDYLLKRGITKEQIHLHRIGFCAVGKFSYRIIFPVYTRKTLVGLVGRDFSGVSITNSEVPRYLNSEGTKTLYNVPSVKSKLAILSEGPIDALAIERAVQFGDSLGRLGSTLTHDQEKILLRYKEICVWPDPDMVGVKGSIAVCKFLSRRRKVSVVVGTDNDSDPGKLGETEQGLKTIEKRIRNRIPWNSETVPLLLKSKVLFQD